MNIFVEPFFPWDKGEKPYFTNELGIEWYMDKSTTEYIKKDTPIHKGLNDVYCFFIKEINGKISRILIDDKQNVLYENQSLEAIGAFIDILKVDNEG